jgi:hypothetical protein
MPIIRIGLFLTFYFWAAAGGPRGRCPLFRGLLEDVWRQALTFFADRAEKLPRLVHRWASLVRPFHGYAGLGILESISESETVDHQPAAYAIARRRAGAESARAAPRRGRCAGAGRGTAPLRPDDSPGHRRRRHRRRPGVGALAPRDHGQPEARPHRRSRLQGAMDSVRSRRAPAPSREAGRAPFPFPLPAPAVRGGSTSRRASWRCSHRRASGSRARTASRGRGVAEGGQAHRVVAWGTVVVSYGPGEPKRGMPSREAGKGDRLRGLRVPARARPGGETLRAAAAAVARAPRPPSWTGSPGVCGIDSRWCRRPPVRERRRCWPSGRRRCPRTNRPSRGSPSTQPTTTPARSSCRSSPPRRWPCQARAPGHWRFCAPRPGVGPFAGRNGIM